MGLNRRELNMKPGIPWSVKGIDGRAREVAKDAARAEGLTLGEWLNQKILEAAEEDAELKARATRKKVSSSVSRRSAGKQRQSVVAAESPVRDHDNAVTRKLDELFERIASMQSAIPAVPAPAPAYQAVPVETGASAQVMQRLIERIESGEQRTHASLDHLGNRVERLGERVEEIAERPLELKARDIPGFSALEGAVRNIVDHIAKSEAQSRETMSALQNRLADIGGKVADTPKTEGISPEAVAALEQRMVELASQVESLAGNADDKKLKQVFEARIRELAERIDTVRHSAEALGQKAEASASKAARQEAQAIEQRLAALVAEAEDKLSVSGAGDSRLAEIHAEIGKLNNRFEEIREQAATEQEVQALRAALEKLSTRVEEAPGLEPIAQIEQRIAELSQQLEVVSQPAVDLQPQIGHLEQRIQALDNQFASSAAIAQPDPQLAGQLSHIEQRLAATEQQMGSLGAIENSIQQLFASLEQSRAETRELIAGANAAEAGSHPEGDAAPSELKALQDGLAAVRANAEAADQRTQETLEAVHETLAQIIDKLGELDRGGPGAAKDRSAGIDDIAASAAAAAAAMAAAGPAVTPQQPAAQFSPFDDPSSIAAGEVQLQPTAPAAAATPVASSASAGSGQHPASGSNDWLSVVRAHMVQQHGGAPAPAMASGPAAGPSAGHVDFIAAARRAAAAAAPGSPAGATLSTGAGFGAVPMHDVDDSQQSRLASLLSRKSQKGSGKTAGGKDADSTSSRKRLVLAALVLLTAVSAYVVNSGGQSPQPIQQSNLDRNNLVQPAQPAGQLQQSAGKADLPTNAAPVMLPSPSPSPVADASGLAVAADPITTASLPPAGSDPMLSQQPSSFGGAQGGTSIPVSQVEQLPEQIGTSELREAAMSGDARAQFIVASRYLEGRAIGRDHDAAARWYLRAANGGLSAAQYRIGTLYERGSGVAQDKLQAMSWYARAAEQGNVKAMHNLAVLSADATLGKPDMTRAAKWFAAAAAHGLPDSQYNYAVLNERGLGVQKNANEAYKWYLLAARQGDRDAIKKAEALKGQLDPATVSAIESATGSWKAEPANRDANMVSVSEPSWGIEQPQQQASAGQAPVSSPMTAEPVQTLTARDQVKLAQQLLAQKGFDPGVADGEMGSRTANAIRLYQLRNGLPVNGSVSKPLLEHLQRGTI
jgi:localization factor PodJL